MAHQGFYPLSNTHHIFNSLKNLGRDALSVLYVEATHSRATGLCPCPANSPHQLAVSVSFSFNTYFRIYHTGSLADGSSQACKHLSPFLAYAKKMDSLMDDGMSISTIHDKICKACYCPFLFPSQISQNSSFRPGHLIDSTRTPCRDQTQNRFLPIILFMTDSAFKDAVGYHAPGPVTPNSLAQWLLEPVGTRPDGRIRLHLVELTCYFLRLDVIHTPHHHTAISKNLRSAESILLSDPLPTYMKQATTFRAMFVLSPRLPKPPPPPATGTHSQASMKTKIIDLTGSSPVPSTSQPRPNLASSSSSQPKIESKAWTPPPQSIPSTSTSLPVPPYTLSQIEAPSPGPTRTSRPSTSRPKPYSNYNRTPSLVIQTTPSPSREARRVTTILQYGDWKKTVIKEY
jgi:hypothetical protein